MSASGFLDEIGDVGRDPKRGGYSRHSFDAPEQDLRAWFGERALGLGLDVDTDHNGNMWAWWGPPGPDAVVTGSHLDSVPGGGAFDGPLGVVSALAAVESLRGKGFRPGSRSPSSCSPRRRAAGSASRASARGCSPARSTPTRRAGCATPTA